MPHFLRKLVSKKKRRFDQEGFKLDLAYITPQIIAMGFPSQGREAMFRNPMAECQRFAETRHKDHYKVYNLCAERRYDACFFNGRVECFPFYDHQACPLQMIFDLCRSVQAFLREDPLNVVIIHCKAGKGRTGLMITAFMLFDKQFPTVEEALKFYGEKRTHNGKGVTIASQQRYVRYFFQVMHMDNAPEAPSREITGISRGEYVKILGPDNTVLWEGITDALSGKGVTVQGDVKIELMQRKEAKGCAAKQEYKKLAHVWFNTYFVDDASNRLVFKKGDCDKGKKLPNDFEFTVDFKPLSAPVQQDKHVQQQTMYTAPLNDSNGAVSSGDVQLQRRRSLLAST
eukprot:ANDGO_02994.mRNA.1 Phosphatidylinositol 3